MTEQEADKHARELWGPKAGVQIGLGPWRYWVGQYLIMADNGYTIHFWPIGTGHSWEEAFDEAARVERAIS